MLRPVSRESSLYQSARPSSRMSQRSVESLEGGLSVGMSVQELGESSGTFSHLRPVSRGSVGSRTSFGHGDSTPPMSPVTFPNCETTQQKSSSPTFGTGQRFDRRGKYHISKRSTETTQWPGLVGPRKSSPGPKYLLGSGFGRQPESSFRSASASSFGLSSERFPPPSGTASAKEKRMLASMFEAAKSPPSPAELLAARPNTAPGASFGSRPESSLDACPSSPGPVYCVRGKIGGRGSHGSSFGRARQRPDPTEQTKENPAVGEHAGLIRPTHPSRPAPSSRGSTHKPALLRPPRHCRYVLNSTLGRAGGACHGKPPSFGFGTCTNRSTWLTDARGELFVT